MNDAPPLAGLRLRSFEPGDAAIVAAWVYSQEELHWLAPSTSWPLTAAKVLTWPKPRGRALLLVHEGDPDPLGYCELNPMGGNDAQIWLGHVIIRPDARRRGIGKDFVRLQVEYAFHDLGARTVSLIVFPDNAPAVACYRRTGFIPVGEEYHSFMQGSPRERMLRFEMHATDLGISRRSWLKKRL